MTQKPLFLTEPRYSGHMPSAHTRPSLALAASEHPERDTQAESGRDHPAVQAM